MRVCVRCAEGRHIECLEHGCLCVPCHRQDSLLVAFFVGLIMVVGLWLTAYGIVQLCLAVWG